MKKLGGRDSIVVGGVNWNIGERPLDGIKPSATRRKGRHYAGLEK